MRYRISLILTLTLALSSWAAFAADTPPPLKIIEKSLPNGLKAVLAEDRSRPVINLQVWYHVGSKDEKTGRTGFAHLFEHMMFRGSKNVKPEEHMRLVRQAGGVVNAYTSQDTTVYWQTFPSNHLERMLWLEADRMRSLDVSEENFKKEREVVKEERRLRIENPPYGQLGEDVFNAAYSVYPYKHTPIGSMEDLNKATIEDVKAFHDLYYVPNNATIVIVGDFDTEQAFEMMRKHFGAIPKGKPVPRVTVKEPEQTAAREKTVQYASAPLDAVVSAYQLPPASHPDRYALEIASNILSSGQSSRLYRRLVYEEQSAIAAAGEASFLEGPSLFFGFGVANQGKNIKEVASSLDYTFEEMKKSPVSDEELTKAKNQVIAGFITGRQTVQAKADFLGAVSVLYGDPQKYNTELANYQKVTAADVQRVVQKYLAKERMTRLWVQPAKAAPAKPEASEKQ